MFWTADAVPEVSTLRRKKNYGHLSGSSAYYPYAARSGLRKRQHRRALLLRFFGVVLLALAGSILARQLFLRDGQPPAPVLTVAESAVPFAGSAVKAPIDVAIRLATAETAAGQPAGMAATAESAAPVILPALRELYNQNSDLVGWLTVEGTKIDYPVLQTPQDNTYYLRRGFSKGYSLSGSLFLDASCRIGSPATANWVIYGHNMSSGGMFGTLARYADADFYAAHPTFVFSTLYHTSRWQVVAALRTEVGADELPYYYFFDAASEADWQAHYDAIQALALYDTGADAHYGDQLLTLSTCGTSSSFTDKRFAVVAMRLD